MKLLKDSIIYLGSSLINKSIPFLLLPILTNYLSPEEYGILSIFLILITFYNAFIGMNINVNISKNFFRSTKKDLSIIVYNSLLILLISFLLFFGITWVATYFFEDIFSIPQYWFRTIPIISLLFMIITINLTIIRNEEKPYTFGLFEISNTIVTMSLTVILLVYYSYGWISQVIGTLVGYLIFSAISLLYMQKHKFITKVFDREKSRDILRTSIPLVPHVLGGIVIAVSDRLFIERMIDLDTVGIYSVGYTFGLVVILFTDAFIKAWNPWFFKNLANPTQGKKIRIVKYTYAYILAVFILALGIGLMGEWILPYVVDEGYYGAKKYIIWVALGYAVHGVYKIFYPYLVFINKTSFLAVSSVLAAIINLIFNYFLIKSYGAIGAAYSTIIAFVVSSLMVYYYQKSRYPMPWKLSELKDNQSD